MNQIATQSEQALSKVILEGDLSKLSPADKVMYYKQVCESVGLNPLTQPLAFIRFQGKEVLYAGKNCTEQLRDINGISLKIISREQIGDVYIVTAEAINRHGRCDSSTGVVNIKGLQGDALANAFMKAETKAKRRVTLSVSGLGYLDESETDSVPKATKLDFDIETGEVIENTNNKPKLELLPKPELKPLSEDDKFWLDAINMQFSENDKLNAFESWEGLNKEGKEVLWPHMTIEIKKWIQEIVKSMKNKDGAP